MKIVYTTAFIKEFKKLPKKIQVRYSYLEFLFTTTGFHSKLHVKRLKGDLKTIYSLRITCNYRVLFKLLSADEAVLLTVKHRKDIYV